MRHRNADVTLEPASLRTVFVTKIKIVATRSNSSNLKEIRAGWNAVMLPQGRVVVFFFRLHRRANLRLVLSMNLSVNDTRVTDKM